MKILFTILLFIRCFSLLAQEEEVIPYSKQMSNDSVFYFVDKLPEFKGGMEKMYEYLGEKTVYPFEAREKNIQGKVYVKFVVTKKGKIGEVKIVKGADSLLNIEAIRVIQSMPKWKPGEQRGKKVNAWFTLPINFTIGE